MKLFTLIAVTTLVCQMSIASNISPNYSSTTISDNKEMSFTSDKKNAVSRNVSKQQKVSEKSDKKFRKRKSSGLRFAFIVGIVGAIASLIMFGLSTFHYVNVKRYNDKNYRK